MEIKRFYLDLKNDFSYLIPVLAFTAVSVLHVAAGWEIYIIVIMQVATFAWAAVVAYRRDLVLWPAAMIGLLFLLINSGSLLYREYILHGVTAAIAADDTLSARDMLEYADSDWAAKSKQYLQLQGFVNTRIEQQTAELILKAKNELKENNLNEAKKTVSMILDYDSNNITAAEMSGIITAKEIAAVEKQLPPETYAGLKKLRTDINLFIARKKFNDAKMGIDDFLKSNPAVDKSSILITELSDLVEEKEKGAELAQQKQMNYKRLDDALARYRKKEYGESVKLLEEVLSYDRKNSAADKLLQKAEAGLRKERTALWKNIAVICAIAGGLVFFIWRRW